MAIYTRRDYSQDQDKVIEYFLGHVFFSNKLAFNLYFSLTNPSFKFHSDPLLKYCARGRILSPTILEASA